MFFDVLFNIYLILAWFVVILSFCCIMALVMDDVGISKLDRFRFNF